MEVPRNTAYFALDDSSRSVQGRTKRLVPPDDAPDNLFVIDDANRIRLDYFGIRALELYIEKHNIEFLILDTWIHVRPQPDNIKGKTLYDLDYEALIPLRDMVADKRMGAVIVTHTTKSTDILNPF